MNFDFSGAQNAASTDWAWTPQTVGFPANFEGAKDKAGLSPGTTIDDGYLNFWTQNLGYAADKNGLVIAHDHTQLHLVIQAGATNLLTNADTFGPGISIIDDKPQVNLGLDILPDVGQSLDPVNDKFMVAHFANGQVALHEVNLSDLMAVAVANGLVTNASSGAGSGSGGTTNPPSTGSPTFAQGQTLNIVYESVQGQVGTGHSPAASDENGNALPAADYVLGGPDADKFDDLATSGGEIRFKASAFAAGRPDIDAPTDADEDNVYVVTVTATDPANSLSTTQTLNVEVTIPNILL